MPLSISLRASSDADYAVIDLKLVEQMAPRFGETEQEMLDLVTKYFELIDTVDEFPYSANLVYRRKGGPASHYPARAPSLGAPALQAAAATAMANEQSAKGLRPR